MILYILLLLPILPLLKRFLFPKKKKGPALPPPQTKVSSGEVAGCWQYSTNGRLFASFSGIPFARPPTGERRFLRPEPAEPWEGVRKCTKSKEFIQRNIFKAGNPPVGEEDALVLNVYSPNIKLESSPLPVMVFIHGGAYVTGSNGRDLYGSEHFMDKEVVMVALNYRLSVLGSLYLEGGRKVPGNQGMRDQVLGLQWVQQNIAQFGGDPSKVTIFGESAGGMSVMNHVLSPMSRGLFSAAIAMSGSPLSPFVGADKHPAFYGRKLAERLGCNSEDSIDKILKKLQESDALEIQSLAFFLEEFIRSPSPFKPIVDGGLVEDPFLPEEPLELLKKGNFAKVPLMIGTNQNEGLLIKAFYDRDHTKYDEAYDNWKTIGPLALFHRERDEVIQEETDICMEFREQKFGNLRFSSKGKAAAALVQMYGDLMFTAPADMAVKLMSGHEDAAPVYHYVYNHQGSLSLFDVMTSSPLKMAVKIVGMMLGLDLFKSKSGVCHADELFLMFKAHALPVNLVRSSEDRRVNQSLVNMWTDFATHHDPTPVTKKWTRFRPDCPQYLEIGSQEEKMIWPEDHARRMEEWSKIYEKVPPAMAHKVSPTWKMFLTNNNC